MVRTPWTETAPPDVLAAARAKIEAGHGYRAVHRMLDLQRYVGLTAWKETAAEWWAAAQRRRADTDGPGRTDLSARDVLANGIRSIADAMAAGALKPNQAISAIDVLTRVVKLEEIELPKDERDAEKHDAWRVEMAAKVTRAIDDATEGGTKSLHRDQIVQTIDDVMRGKKPGDGEVDAA